MGLVRQHQKGDRPCGKREDAWRNKVGAPSVEYGKRQESRREEVRQLDDGQGARRALLELEEEAKR